jgi:uncharacterized HAD superfamily protein
VAPNGRRGGPDLPNRYDPGNEEARRELRKTEENNMKAVIVDIDGTISDVEHRRHHLLAKPKNWKAFNAAMHFDIPRSDVVELVKILQRDGNRIVLCTGREEVYRSGTEDWLAKHDVPNHALYMRAAKDYREDDIVKSELLDQIISDGYEPWLAIDDRDRVVAMWRARGLTCLQCAPGDF